MGTAASWIGLGISHPFSKIPISKARDSAICSNCIPCVSVTS